MKIFMRNFRYLLIALLVMAFLIPSGVRTEADAAYMVYCSHCGAQISADSNYCNYCGHRNGQVSSVSTPSCYIPSNPKSPYGKALRRNLIDGVYYSDVDKKNVVVDTYYSRKNQDGSHKSWYYSTNIDDPNTGYKIGFYYADGVLFYAEAFIKGHAPAVTFYFWGDQLVSVHDKRCGDSKMCYAGSFTYDRVVEEFGNLYYMAN